MSYFAGRRRGAALPAVSTLAVGVLALSGCTLPDADRTDVSWSRSASAERVSTPESSTSPSTEPSTSPADVPENVAEVLTTLSTIPVKGRAPKTGYDRALFGQAWTDDVPVDGGHNGCDTRNDILRRDLTVLTVKPRTRECVILTGVLRDPYTGQTVAFTRGQRTSSAVQIDHVVALSDAWQKGAQQLTTDERQAFANDPLNLQAVDGPTNTRKRDGDAATWLPPNKAYRCTYVSRQIEVKARYRLWVTDAESQAMRRILRSC